MMRYQSFSQFFCFALNKDLKLGKIDTYFLMVNLVNLLCSDKVFVAITLRNCRWCVTLCMEEVKNACKIDFPRVFYFRYVSGCHTCISYLLFKENISIVAIVSAGLTAGQNGTGSASIFCLLMV